MTNWFWPTETHDRPDFTKLDIILKCETASYFDAEDKPRFHTKYPCFVGTNIQVAIEKRWVSSPHEYFLLEYLEFARRYPNHPRAAYHRANPEFTDAEIAELGKGDKRIIVKEEVAFADWEEAAYIKQQEELKQNAGLLSRPRADLSKEPVALLAHYKYWLTGDDLNSTPRGIYESPVFLNYTPTYMTGRGWSDGDGDYNLFAEFEFIRRYPNHSWSKENRDSTYDKFTTAEREDIVLGKRRLITYSCKHLHQHDN